MSESSFPIPADVARVAALFSAFPHPWALCGGWAVDVWLGRQTRAHHDVDLVIFAEHQQALREHFAGWQLVAHDLQWSGDDPVWPGQPIPDRSRWDGRTVTVPGHFHLRAPDDESFDFEVNLLDREGAEWVLSREPRLALPLTDVIRPCAWGFDAVAPEVAAYYKVVGVPDANDLAPQMRPHDIADVGLLVPALPPERLTWLRAAVATVAPDHPWLADR
ncbi:MAG: nucleotidyltransferase domain-containing protein [Dehalococcoidia bacterium]